MDILEETLETSDDCVSIQLKSEEVDDPKPIASELTIIDDDGSMSDDQGPLNTHSILDGDDVQYQWKTNNGVTYRVYQVNPEDVEGESVAEDYQPGSGQIQPVVLTSSNLQNHFYVVGNDVLATQSPRSLAPRSNLVIDSRSGGPTIANKVRRDDRRRATHNEVERRRRDKINNWILKLSKIIPDCSALDNNKSNQSKGCILAKACEYILELRDSSEKAADLLRENERLANHVEYLQSVNDKLKVENSLLRRAPGSNIRPSSSHES